MTTPFTTRALRPSTVAWNAW